MKSLVLHPAARAGVLADSINDADSTRKVYMLAAGLAALGIVLIAMTVWFWRSTRHDPELLAPLETLGSRRFRKMDDGSKRQLLDAVRPADAKPMRWGVVRGSATAEPEIDLGAIRHAAVSDYNDLREPAVPVIEAIAAMPVAPDALVDQVEIDESVGHEWVGHESVGDESAAIEPVGYESAAIEPVGYESAAIESAGYESAAIESAGYESAADESAAIEPVGRTARDVDTGEPAVITDASRPEGDPVFEHLASDGPDRAAWVDPLVRPMVAADRPRFKPDPRPFVIAPLDHDMPTPIEDDVADVPVAQTDPDEDQTTVAGSRPAIDPLLRRFEHTD